MLATCEDVGTGIRPKPPGKVISACEKEGAWQQALLWLQADLRAGGGGIAEHKEGGGVVFWGLLEDPMIQRYMAPVLAEPTQWKISSL